MSAAILGTPLARNVHAMRKTKTRSRNTLNSEKSWLANCPSTAFRSSHASGSSSLCLSSSISMTESSWVKTAEAGPRGQERHSWATSSFQKEAQSRASRFKAKKRNQTKACLTKELLSLAFDACNSGAAREIHALQLGAILKVHGCEVCQLATAGKADRLKLRALREEPRCLIREIPAL